MSFLWLSLCNRKTFHYQLSICNLYLTLQQLWTMNKKIYIWSIQRTFSNIKLGYISVHCLTLTFNCCQYFAIKTKKAYSYWACLLMYDLRLSFVHEQIWKENFFKGLQSPGGFITLFTTILRNVDSNLQYHINLLFIYAHLDSPP